MVRLEMMTSRAIVLLHLVVWTVAVLSKDDDCPGVDVNTLVELLPPHVPHT